jgi:universal stress protein E
MPNGSHRGQGRPCGGKGKQEIFETLEGREAMVMKQASNCPVGWKKLLVCTDGSSEGQNAVSETLALAQANGAKVYVVRVVEIVPEFEAVVPDLRACLEEEIGSEMEAVKAEAARLGVDFETRILPSQMPHAAIVAEAQRLQADLIIMGRYGRSGLARLLVGNVTARVIGHSPVNILVVPRGATLAFQRLLVASDGSPFSAAAFAEALSLARETDAQMFAVSVAREEGDILEAQQIVHQMLMAANQAGLPLTGLSPQGQMPDDAIIQEAIRNGADLIIIGSHGRTGFQRLFMGSVTERVIGQTTCPVLVVKK